MPRPLRALAIFAALVLLSLTFTSPTTADPGSWDLRGNAGTTPGFQFLGTTDKRPLVLKVNGERGLLIRPSSGTPNLIGGASFNRVARGVEGATISGGGIAVSQRVFPNRVIDDFGTVGGGAFNLAGSKVVRARFATIGGGSDNRATGFGATVAGGTVNRASDSSATVGGGNGNRAGHIATVAGGASNRAIGSGATVPGGHRNTASGDFSLAAGRRAKADAKGAFVWADSNDIHGVDFRASRFPCGGPSCGVNTFNVRSTGGARFVSAINPISGAPTAGVVLQPGAGSWSSLSDRHAKVDVRPVDPRAVLRSLAGVPISTFRYRAQEPGVRHMGPMAQDFHRAFGLGESPRYIATVDADGVALAAIKGLHARVRAQGHTIGSLKDEVALLESLLRAQGEQITALQREVRRLAVG